MIEAKFSWNGDPVVRALEEAAWEGLQRAALRLHTHLLETLNVPNTGESRKHPTRKTASGRPATYTIYPHSSRPGEPPRKRTGWLQRNVRYELDRSALRARVGVTENARYGLYLEFGTARVAARPWLDSTFRVLLPELRALVLAPVEKALRETKLG